MTYRELRNALERIRESDLDENVIVDVYDDYGDDCYTVVIDALEGCPCGCADHYLAGSLQ